MDKEFKQRANESAERMIRAGMTLSAGIMQDLLTALEQQEVENAAQTEYIRFIETELMQAQTGNTAAPQNIQEIREENPQLREIRLNHMVLVGELNN